MARLSRQNLTDSEELFNQQCAIREATHAIHSNLDTRSSCPLIPAIAPCRSAGVRQKPPLAQASRTRPAAAPPSQLLCLPLPSSALHLHPDLTKHLHSPYKEYLHQVYISVQLVVASLALPACSRVRLELELLPLAS